MGAATKIFITLIAGAITMGLLLGIYYLLIPSFSENLDAPKYLDVTIRLQNECTFQLVACLHYRSGNRN